MVKELSIDPAIFQDLVDFYGNQFGLPPLAAKIYAYLAFDFERDGLCFDDFVEIFEASKSSISANLNILLSAKLIKHQNKMNERKRYFIINNDYLKIRFQQIISRLETELDVLERLQEFSGRKLDQIENYNALMTKNINSIKNSLTKF